MTNIEPKEAFRQIGINLINEYRQQRGLKPIDWLAIDTPETNALIRSIQLHEKTKKEFSDFQQEVIGAVMQAFSDTGLMPDYLKKLILPKPEHDPLVGVCNVLGWNFGVAEELRIILDALGFEIREKNDG